MLLQEGETVEFKNSKATLGKKIQTKHVYVDAYGVGDVGDLILRDRKTLSTEGVVFVLIKVDANNALTEDPECISRGFVYGKGDERKNIFKGAIIGKMW